MSLYGLIAAVVPNCSSWMKDHMWQEVTLMRMVRWLLEIADEVQVKLGEGQEDQCVKCLLINGVRKPRIILYVFLPVILLCFLFMNFCVKERGEWEAQH